MTMLKIMLVVYPNMAMYLYACSCMRTKITKRIKQGKGTKIFANINSARYLCSLSSVVNAYRELYARNSAMTTLKAFDRKT